MRQLAIAGIVKPSPELATAAPSAPSSAIASKRDYQLRRVGRELVVDRRGKRWGLWPQCAPLTPPDVVEIFKRELSEFLDWELANLFVLEDGDA
jgi:hypothetical protein